VAILGIPLIEQYADRMAQILGYVKKHSSVRELYPGHLVVNNCSRKRGAP
jgi:hypothetical protein